jgi:serine/threonine protein kinase
VPQIYGDRWEFIRTLGEGGQAHTYEVRDLRDGSTGWVLKRLKNPKRLPRFEREIRALDALNSSHIPKTIDYSTHDRAYHVTRLLGVGLDRLGRVVI